MPVIVVTRLRVRDVALNDEFLTLAVATLEQAQGSTGNLGADALADANDVWWTVTSWHDRVAMRGFVATEPHRSTMGQLDRLCDEATFVDWDADDAALPDWQVSHQRLVADGSAATLTNPSPEHARRAFPAPVTGG